MENLLLNPHCGQGQQLVTKRPSSTEIPGSCIQEGPKLLRLETELKLQQVFKRVNHRGS